MHTGTRRAEEEPGEVFDGCHVPLVKPSGLSTGAITASTGPTANVFPTQIQPQGGRDKGWLWAVGEQGGPTSDTGVLQFTGDRRGTGAGVRYQAPNCPGALPWSPLSAARRERFSQVSTAGLRCQPKQSLVFEGGLGCSR